MKIALTGTPGAGKTTISRLYEEKGYRVIHLSEYVKENSLGEQQEEFEVDLQKMKASLEKEEFDVIEGHLAHHVETDFCIVLRTRPDKLRERLKNRDYSERKIEENVQSEILDLILTEAVEKQEKVIELDTTRKTPEDVLKEVENKIEKGESDYGKFDWTEFI